MLFNEHMKLIDDIRRENLAALADAYGGVAGLARKLDRSESQISQWVRGAAHSVTGRKRGMKSETARWIEATTSKPAGWLDQNHEAPQMPERDADFVRRIEQAVARYEVPDHVQQAILTIITTLPPRPEESNTNTPATNQAKAA